MSSQSEACKDLSIHESICDLKFPSNGSYQIIQGLNHAIIFRLVQMKFDKPIAYFLDINSCPLPNSKDSVDCVQLLREHFGFQRNEMDFIIACDVNEQIDHVAQRLVQAPLVNSIVKIRFLILLESSKSLGRDCTQQ